MSRGQRFLVGSLLTAGLMALLVSQIRLGMLGHYLGRIGIGWAAVIAGAYLITYVFRALRFGVLLGVTSFGRLFLIVAVHNFVARLLPLRTGEVSYLYLVRRFSSASLAKGGATLAVARIQDAVAVAVLFFAAAGVEARLVRGISAGMITTVTILGVLLWQLDRVLFLVSSLLARLPGLPPRTTERVVELARTTAQEVKRLRRAGVYPVTFLLTICSWMSTLAMFYAFIRGFGVPLGALAALAGSTACIVTSALPVNGIGSFGTVEVGWAAGYMALGVNKQTAIATGIAMNLTVFSYSLLFAAASWLALLYQEQRRRRPAASTPRPESMRP